VGVISLKLGFIGLGKMGFNMVENLLDHKHEVAAFDLSSEAVKKISEKGAQEASSLKELADKLPSPKIIWLMVPAGAPVDNTLKEISQWLGAGDIVIDGGNSNYKDSIRRAAALKEKGIAFLDVGTSGGLSGARKGACMMIGGQKEIFDKIEELFSAMCVEKGYGYVGKSGAGHFVKMVHNGIEYGMLEAIGEGFELLSASDFNINFNDVARIWANGSVIRGWLMELAQSAFAKDGKLEHVSGEVADSGEGAWTVESSLELNVAIPVITTALQRRYRSRESSPLSDRLVAALRHEFGGHAFKKK
jgi:6-phosphogluconate dehydrogenase